MRAAGASDGACALVIVAIPSRPLSSLFIVRAQLFSLPLFALAVLLLRSEARAPSRRIWLLVPLVALWSNLHGAVLTGLAVASVYLVLDAVRRQPLVALGVLAASWRALLVTPALRAHRRVLPRRASQRAGGERLRDVGAAVAADRPSTSCSSPWRFRCSWFAVRARTEGVGARVAAAFATLTVHVGRNSIWLSSCRRARGCGPRSRPPRGFRARLSVAHRRAVPAVLVVAGMLHAPRCRTVAGSAFAGRRRSCRRGRRSSPRPRTPSALRSTGGACGSQIRSTRSPHAISARTSTGSGPGRRRCCAPRVRGLVLLERDSQAQRRLARDRRSAQRRAGRGGRRLPPRCADRLSPSSTASSWSRSHRG